jgi:hypothetical protein
VAEIAGVGKDAPIHTNEKGAKQSASPYRCDLLDGPAILRLAAVLKYGADKYAPNNWRGIPTNDHINHALVHIFAYLAGDTQDDHLGHFLCRAMMAVAIEEQEKRA